MTSNTTDINRTSRRIMPIVWTISIAFHLAILSVVIYWQATGGGELAFDHQATSEKAEQVKKRSEELAEQQRQQREQRRLDEKTAEKLKQEEQRKRQRNMTKDISELQLAREELNKVRAVKLEQIVNRPATDIQDGQLANMASAARELLNRVERHNNSQPSDPTFAEELRKRAVIINWIAGHNMNDSPEQLRGNARRILTELKTTRTDINARNDAEKFQAISEQMDVLEAIAKIVAGDFDIKQYNDISTSNLKTDPDSLKPPAVKTDTPADTYDSAVKIEADINKIKQDIAAAEIANAQAISFSEAIGRTPNADPQRPDLGEQLRQAPLNTVSDLNQYRELLDQAGDETQRMATRAEGLTRQMNGEQDATAAAAQRLSNSRQWGRMLANSRGQVVDLTKFMQYAGPHAGSFGGGDSGGGDDVDLTSRGSDMPAPAMAPAESKLDLNRIYANALPGRRFGPQSKRKGWLFIDTWYMIGPWQRINGPDFPGTFPPELTIDLDAKYTDGYVVPDKNLDGTVEWQYLQADALRVQPPVVVGGSVYYAYTEVYFEQAQDMLFAIASDDQSKVWVNDLVVWQDQGLSSWRFDEGFRKLSFRKGYNKILVRLENGPGFCYFSLLICPPNALDAK